MLIRDLERVLLWTPFFWILLDSTREEQVAGGGDLNNSYTSSADNQPRRRAGRSSACCLMQIGEVFGVVSAKREKKCILFTTLTGAQQVNNDDGMSAELLRVVLGLYLEFSNRELVITVSRPRAQQIVVACLERKVPTGRATKLVVVGTTH